MQYVYNLYESSSHKIFRIVIPEQVWYIAYIGVE